MMQNERILKGILPCNKLLFIYGTVLLMQRGAPQWNNQDRVRMMIK